MELLILKMLHIFTAAFWAGAVIFMAAFVGPAAAAAGPAGGNFMQKLMARKVPIWMMVASILNLLTGFRLLAIDSNGFSNGDFFSSPRGLTLTIGAVAAIIAIVVGMVMNRPAAAGMQKIAKEIGANPPTAEQGAQVAALRRKLTTGNNTIAILLSIALILMSINEYVNGVFM